MIFSVLFGDNLWHKNEKLSASLKNEVKMKIRTIQLNIKGMT